MLKVAIFGSGTMARIYARLLRQHPHAALHAIVGNSEARTAAFASELAVPGYAQGDFAAMWRDHPDVDAVIVATPEWVRLAPVGSVVAHRAHLLLEKPFACTVHDREALERLLDGYDRCVEVCHVLRFSPRFVAMRKAVAQGAIGEVRHIYARRNSNRHRVRRVLGMMDLSFWLAPHDIDIMRLITGSEVVEVFARSRDGMRTEDDYLITHLRFANGVDAVLEISWCSPPLSGAVRSAAFEVWGTTGHIALDDADMNVRVFMPEQRVEMPDTYETFEIAGVSHGLFAPLVDHFVSRSQDGRPSVVSVADAVAATRVCEMIAESVSTGQRVQAT